MINKELISASLPVLSPKDPVYRALQLMDDTHMAQLPVVDEERYIGLVAENDLRRATIACCWKRYRKSAAGGPQQPFYRCGANGQ
ncbi:MAG: CBS domain-containing protein [Flavihumibacter sp.]